MPSRLIGEWAEVRLFAEHVEVRYAQRPAQQVPRLRGEGKHRIDYRHVIDALARAAHDTSELEVFVSLEPFASDHVPFIDAGLPAVLTIEGEDQLNLDEHTPRDTLATLDLAEKAFQWRREIIALLVGAEADPPARIHASVALGGMSDCVVEYADLPFETVKTAAVGAAVAALL